MFYHLHLAIFIPARLSIPLVKIPQVDITAKW